MNKPYYHIIGKSIFFLWEKEWREGHISNGYRTRDGIINVTLVDGKKLWCGEARHEEFLKNRSEV